MSVKLHKKLALCLIIVSVAVSISALILLCAFIFGNYRLDATPNRIYSLSQKTLDFLKNNEVPISIRFYQSAELENKNPKLGEYASYVRKFLQEYKDNGHGKIDLSWIEVKPFQNTQASAEKAGVKEFDYNDGDRYLYLGASFTTAKGISTVIPQFTLERQNVLEDDITRSLSVLTASKRVKVGIISPFFDVVEDKNEFMKNTKDFPFVKALKQQGFQVEALSENMISIPEDVDAVIVFYPSKYEISGVYALDQYLVRGGKVIIFLDSFSEERFRGEESFVPYESGILPLLDNSGIFYHENQLVGNNIHNRELILEGHRIRYPFWLKLESDNLSDHPILKGISHLNFNHSGFFETAPIEGLNTTVLITTDEKSGIMPANKIVNLSNDYLMANYLETEEKYPLVVLVEGKFHSLFGGAFVNNIKVMAHFLPFLPMSDREGKLLLIGDSDMASAFLWQDDFDIKAELYQKGYSSDNILFLRNALDYLTDSGYVEIPMKIKTRSFNITDVLAKKAVNLYQKQKDMTLRDRKNIKMNIAEMSSQMLNETVPSIHQTKKLEELKRKEIEIDNELDRISYLIAEKYDSLNKLFFGIAIVVLPFLLVLFIGLGYFFYQKRKYHCFERVLK